MWRYLYECHLSSAWFFIYFPAKYLSFFSLYHLLTYIHILVIWTWLYACACHISRLGRQFCWYFSLLLKHFTLLLSFVGCTMLQLTVVVIVFDYLILFWLFVCWSCHDDMTRLLSVVINIFIHNQKTRDQRNQKSSKHFIANFSYLSSYSCCCTRILETFISLALRHLNR